MRQVAILLSGYVLKAKLTNPLGAKKQVNLCVFNLGYKVEFLTPELTGYKIIFL